MLRDAVTLHDAGAYSSAVALALFAREELGRHRILVDFWKRAHAGSPPTANAARAACDDHVEKQRHGQLSNTYYLEGDTGLARLVRVKIDYPPDSPEYKRATEELARIDKMVSKRPPGDRHTSRTRAIYVDLDESGERWNRPSRCTRIESDRCLRNAVGDYSVQAEEMQTPVLLKIREPDLSDAVEAWQARPPLPPTIWPRDSERTEGE